MPADADPNRHRPATAKPSPLDEAAKQRKTRSSRKRKPGWLKLRDVTGSPQGGSNYFHPGIDLTQYVCVTDRARWQGALTLLSVDVTDQAKSPLVEQSQLQPKDTASVKCEKDRRWLLDKLEDDEVRQALKSSTSLVPSKQGRTAVFRGDLQPGSDRNPHQLRHAAHIGLGHQVGSVDLNRARADT